MKRNAAIISILMISCPIAGMEKAPSTPVKSSASHLVTLFNSIHSAITGTLSSKFTEDMITPEMKEVSPENLFLSIQQQLYKEMDEHFVAKGIDRATIDRLAPAIQKSLNEAVEGFVAHSPLKSPFKQEFAKVLEEAPCTNLIVRHAETEKVAFSLGNLIVVDTQRLQVLAPSPSSREQIYKHERTHAHNNDSAIRMVIETAFKEKGKELSPHSKDLITRTQEVIADLGPMSKSHKAAAAGVRVMARMVKACGPGIPGEHPAHGDRLSYSKAMSAITREAEAKKKAAAENMRPEDGNSPVKSPAKSPIKVLKSRKRLMFDEEQPAGTDMAQQDKRPVSHKRRIDND